MQIKVMSPGFSIALSLTSHQYYSGGRGFSLPFKGATTAGIYVQVPDAGVNFLIDTASAQELPHNPHWMSDANKRINSIRKAPVTFKLVIKDFNFQTYRNASHRF
jgi:hypothetical protein